jgi:hypothetical protein
MKLEPNLFPPLLRVVTRWLAVLSLTLFGASLSAAPSVTNVTAQQRTDTRLVDITYDLEHSEDLLCTVTVEASTDGENWIVLTNLSGSGAFGLDVVEGTGKTIVWDAGLEWPSHLFPSVEIRVRANDVQIPPDVIAPTLSEISATPAPTSAALQFTSDEAGTAYFLAQAGGSAPNAAQVKDGSGNGGTVSGAGSSAAINGINNFDLTGLNERTAYTLYFIVEDAAGNQSAVASVAATTTVTDNTAPTYTSSQYPSSATTFTFSIKATEDCTLYYLAQEGGDAPSAEQLKDGSGNGGTVAGAGSRSLVRGTWLIPTMTGLIEGTNYYKIYLMVEDAAGNQSPVLHRFSYTTPDETPPTLSALSAVPAEFSADLQFSSDETGTVYFLAQSGGTEPSDSQVSNGFGGADGTVAGAGNAVANAGVNNVTLTGLLANTSYTIYLIIDDDAGNRSTLGSVSTTTLVDTTNPTLSAASGSAIDTTAAIQFTSDEAGTAYFLAQNGGSAPSAAQVKSGSGNGGTVAGVGNSVAVLDANTANLSGLSLLTSYTLYIVVEDPSGNLSSVASDTVSTSDDVTAPEAVITFPTTNSIIEAESSITVYGTASDNANTITSVQVNGVDVTSGDNFANWTISVPLTLGINTLQVSTSDALNNSDANTDEAEINSIALILNNPIGIAIDKANDRVLVLDKGLLAIVAVDLTTGAASFASSDPEKGTGNAFVSPINMDLDPATNHAYVIDGSSIIDVDLATGDRSILSDTNNGTGEPLGILVDLAVDSVNGKILALGWYKVIEVDIATGNRSIFDPGGNGTLSSLNYRSMGILLQGSTIYISSILGQDGLIRSFGLYDGVVKIVATNGVGVGFSMGLVSNMTYYDSSKLIVTNSNFNALIVSLINGDRTSAGSIGIGEGVADLAKTDNTRLLYIHIVLKAVVDASKGIISNNYVGGYNSAGQYRPIPLDGPSHALLDSNNNQLIVGYSEGQYFSGNDSSLLGVDLDSGDRTPALGSGPNYDDTKDIALDSDNNRLFVLVDSPISALVEVDLTLLPSPKTIVTNSIETDDVPAKGSGDTFESGQSVVFDSGNDRALVSAASPRAIFAVDIATGDRSILSEFGSSTGTGIDTLPDHMKLDSGNNRIIGVDTTWASVIAIDITSGNRSVISNSDTGSGDLLVSPIKTALDTANGLAYVLDGTSIIAVDLASGNRTVISSDSIGAGAALANPKSLEIDIQNNRLYVGDTSLNAIFAIQIDTGDRVIMAK